jgi:aspartate ammonia-lyase
MATAEIAKASIATGRPIRDLVLERGLLTAAKVDEILSVEAMTKGGVIGTSGRTSRRPRSKKGKRR